MVFIMETQMIKQKFKKMMGDGRIKYFAPADYSEGTELDALDNDTY